MKEDESIDVASLATDVDALVREAGLSATVKELGIGYSTVLRICARQPVRRATAFMVRRTLDARTVAT